MVEFNSDNNKVEYTIAEYPENAELVGLNEDGLKIFIERTNLFGIEEYLRSDTGNELGGVLVGNVYRDKNKKLFIVIRNNIIAESTNASLSRLTFTHETWEKINENLERDFSGQKILGWYHSHPGHSVFLSTYDVFIQDNFFNLPYMTAFVYDPVINDKGFFYKDETGIKKSGGYYIYGNRAELIKPAEITLDMPKPVEDYERKKNDAKSEDSKDSPMKNIIITALLVINFIFCLLLFLKMNSYEKELLRFENVNNQLNELRSENVKLNQKLDNFTQALETGRINSPDTTKLIHK